MKQQRTFSYAKYGYLFSIPFIVVFCIFNLYPTVYTAVLGFTDCKGLGNTDWNFLTEEPFKNFEQILKNPSFITSVKNTFKIWIMNFIPQITLALLLTAWFTSRRNVLKGQGFFKVVFYMPNIITAASVAILFNALFGYPMGPMNDFLVATGIKDGPVDFMVDKFTTQCIVAFIQFWQWYGYTMIILISGVLGINPEIYEAAEIDGANDIQMFFQVTIPNLKTILLYTLITSLIGGLTMYDIPRLFNDGKPANATLTATMFIHNQAFKGSYMYNRAAAASLLIFIVVAACSAVVFFLMRDKKGDRR
ncbi:MAG: sugar ABC transporter permease [Oscillospiraceae bacterium]|nr:sugar ABC transporter permease [Oscillospiraceae bacterium]